MSTSEFFRPELGMRFKGMQQENRIKLLAKKASFKSAEIGYGDIISVVEWLDAEVKLNLQLRDKAEEKAKRYMMRREELLSIPAVQTIMRDNLGLSDLGLNPRTFYALEGAGVSTVAELCAMSDNDLLGIRRIEQKELEEIKEKLSYHGLCLDDPERVVSEKPDKSMLEDQSDEASIIDELSRKFDELFGSFEDDESE